MRLATLIGAAGLGDIDRIQAAAQRRGILFRLAHIEDDFTAEGTAPFDPVFLRALFDHAQAKARAGYRWKQALPP